MKKIGIKSHIIVPAVAMLFTLFIGLLVGIWMLQADNLELDCNDRLHGSEQFYTEHIQEYIRILTSVTDVLAQDETLRKVWLQHDREALSQQVLPIFSQLKETYKISHLYFIEPDQTVFFRCQRPSVHGDVLVRYTMRKAVQTQKVTAGLDVGKYGTYSMRLIRPWYIDKKLVGYIEISKEISNITKDLQKILGLDVAVLIEKKCLDKVGLAEGKGTPWHKLCWDALPEEAVLYRHPEDLPDQLIGDLKSCDLRDGKQGQIAYKDGKTYRVNSFPLFDASGAKVGRTVVFQDVSEAIASAKLLIFSLGGLFAVVALGFLGLSYWFLGRIEKQLEQSNRKALEETTARERAKMQHMQELLRFEKALNGATDAICITDIHGCPLYYNASFIKIFDIPPDTPHVAVEMLGIYSDPQFAKKIFDTVKHEYHYEGMKEIVSHDGKSLSISIRGSAIMDDNEALIGLLIIHTDITDRIKAEDELRRQAAALRGNNIALEKARIAAQAATVAKSEFLANMSHEIRTPMTAILGFSEALLDPELDQQNHVAAVEIIHRNGEHLLNLINEILDLSKIEACKLAVEWLNCSTQQLLADILSLKQIRAKAKGLKLIVECDGEIPPTIRTDTTRLRQILINLVGNAIKFTETGEVRLVVSLETSDARPMLNFDVIDTGIGIPQENLEEIFKPFTQTDESFTRKYGGSGLGLTICRRLAVLLGGRLTVESKLGFGSRFRLSLPVGTLEDVKMIDLQKEQVQSTSPPCVEASSHNSDSHKQLSGRILLAEDGRDNQTLISHILRKAGAEVTVAENGRVAVDYLWEAKEKSISFDLILMDMQMPVLDGYSATREARSGGYDGPIVALTAHAMVEDREKCHAAGCDDYVTKPITREALIAVAARFLSPLVKQ